MKMKFTKLEVMQWGPCYTLRMIEKYFGRRKYLDFDVLMALPIPTKDKIWCLQQAGFPLDDIQKDFISYLLYRKKCSDVREFLKSSDSKLCNFRTLGDLRCKYKKNRPVYAALGLCLYNNCAYAAYSDMNMWWLEERIIAEYNRLVKKTAKV